MNLDMGGGKYNRFTTALTRKGVTNLVIDPHNRPDEENAAVVRSLLERPADTGTISNVLNVISDPENRRVVMEEAAGLVRTGGSIYITVYEGDASDEGRPTRDGWQANRRLSGYVDEVRRVFPNAERKGRMIVAVNEALA